MELRNISKEELSEMIRKHTIWLNEKEGGERASLEGANLNGASLEGAILDGASLDGANLEGANLNGASLEGAILDGASLDGANLEGANLYDASLEGANLYDANLDGANLEGANLYDANMDGASLDGANLDGASLYCAKGKVLSIGPIGSRNGITYAFWSDKDKSIHIQCGCFYGTFDEWVNKCAATHGDSVHGKNYAAAAAFIKSVAENNNWEAADDEN